MGWTSQQASGFYNIANKPAGYKDNPNYKTEGWTQLEDQPATAPAPSGPSEEELAAGRDRARAMPQVQKPAAPSGGGGGAAAPAPAPMAGLQAAMGGSGGGDGGSGGMVPITPAPTPSNPVSMGGGTEATDTTNVGESIQGLRQGLGTRTPPNMMSALASLGRIY